VYVRLAPLNVPFASVRFGLRSREQEVKAMALLQANLIPPPVWTVALLSCQGTPELFFREPIYCSTFLVSEIIVESHQ
jgi:hypothetical protein